MGTIAAGRYRVLRLLGEGGMGRVYLAVHVAIEKQVALKVLRPEYADKGDIVTRFQQEAISASRIKHPNVLDVFDFGRLDNGCFYLAMEYLEGSDLADEMKRRRLLDAVTTVRIALEICRALGAAHAKGVVHRDLKPENVFLQRSEHGEHAVKIVDFGIALLRNNEQAAAESKHRRLTKTGMIFGTPEYMAPEQAAGKHADHRADIYALGIMLYEMCTGAVPFTGETFLGVLARHLSEAPPPMNTFTPDLAVSPQLQAIVFKALAKNPDERYQSMAELAQALAATPEGSVAARAPLGHSGGATPAFVPPGASNPTAPEFGVVHKAPSEAVKEPHRGAATLASGSGSGSVDERAATQLSAEAVSGDAVRRSRPLGVLGALGAVAALGVAGTAFLVLRSPPAPDARPEVGASAPPVSPAAPTAPAPAVSLAAPTAVPEPSAVALPSRVTLTVETEPPGATVSKNGFQVCDSSPCEVLAEPNETLELDATRGVARGKAKVLAQRDQKVVIKLAAPAAARPPKPSAGPRMCEVEVDGLKILRPCP